MKDVKVYSDNCFSCNVTFTQTIQKGATNEVSYSDYNWVFVNSGGAWKLADMYTNAAAVE